MNRYFSKHTNLTPVLISSRLHGLLICLCLILITGCVTQATPDTWNLEIQDEGLPPLPDLSLVRRVVPEVGTKNRTRWNSVDATVPEVSESRFGDPDEEADLSCVYDGLKEELPDIDIVSTMTFWEQVAAPHDVIELSELFDTPQPDWLRAFQADVIVIAYHTKINVDSTIIALGINNVFGNLDKETAATIVIDLRRKTIIHGSKISFEDGFVFGNLTIFPIVAIKLDPSDICNTVGREAGAAIAEAMPGRAVRALVVVAGENPYEAANAVHHRAVNGSNSRLNVRQNEAGPPM